MMLNFQTVQRTRPPARQDAETKAAPPPAREPAPLALKPGPAPRQPVSSFAGLRTEVPRGASLSAPVQLRDRLAGTPVAASLPLRSAQLDPEMRSTMMVMELMQYLKENLSQEAGPPSPELLGELAEAVRTVVLHMADSQWGEAFSALVQIAGHETLVEDQLVQVFRTMVRGPEELGHRRMVAAAASMCGLFKDKVLPAHWYRAMMRAAQASWNADRAVVTRKAILWMLEGSVVGLQEDDPLRVAQDKAMLLAAVQTCASAPETPVGLVAWMQRTMVREPAPRTTARVFEAVSASPGLSPAQLDNVACILAAGVVAHREPTPTQLANRLRPVLAWCLQQPAAHRDAALDGLANGIGLYLVSSRQVPALVQAVLDLVGRLQDTFASADAPDAARRFIRRMITPGDLSVADTQAAWTAAVASQPLDDRKHDPARETPAAGKGKDKGKAKAGSKAQAPSPAKARLQSSPDTKSSDESSAGALEGASGSTDGTTAPTAQGALAGLRMLFDRRTGDTASLDAELPILGQALACAPADSVLPAETLHVLLEGLLALDIPVHQAGLLLQGLARGVGGAGIGEPAFAAFLQSLYLASEPVAARLSCHFLVAIGAAGAAGRGLAQPVSLRMVHTLLAMPAPQRERLGQPQGEAPLPPGLLLGLNLVDGPLAAVRESELPREAQRQLLLDAYRVPGLLDEALIADEAHNCALLAADDPEFALEAAQVLLEQGHARVGLEAMRALRSGLLAQLLGPQGTGREVMPLATGLDRLGALYGAFVRSHGEPMPAATRAFLVEESGLLRSGLHAQALEPLAARLDALHAVQTINTD